MHIGFQVALDVFKAIKMPPSGENPERTGVVKISHKGVHAIATHLLKPSNHPLLSTETHYGVVVPHSVAVTVTRANGDKRHINAHITPVPGAPHGWSMGVHDPYSGDVHVLVHPGPHHKGDLHKRVRNILAHEVTHAADPGIDSSMRRGDVPGQPDLKASMKQQKLFYSKYVNHPQELAAHMQQIHREVTTPRAVASVQESPTEMHPARLAAFHSPTYGEIREHLTPESHKRVLKMVARAHDAAREGRVTDEESKFRRAIGTLDGWR